MKPLIFVVLAIVFHSQFSFGAEKVRLALNWKPEPEFGGFYEAQQKGFYKASGFEIEILPGGAGQPVTQMIAASKAEFGVSNSDEVVIGRSHSENIVAIYSVFETSPFMIMTHRSKGYKKLDDVFNDSSVTLALEKGQPFAKYLEKKFGYDKIKVVPYAGGVANFLHDKNFAQQGFITSEPLIAKHSGADPQTFLLSDVGFNPYAEVVIVTEDFLKNHGDMVKKFFEATQKGWRSYLNNPAATNAFMHSLNSGMDEKTFNESADTQKPLIDGKLTKKNGLGAMVSSNWKTIIDQMVQLRVIEKSKAPAAEQCFAQMK